MANTICHNNHKRYEGKRKACLQRIKILLERSSNNRSEESHVTSALDMTPSPIWKGSIKPDKTIQVINNNIKTVALYMLAKQLINS